MHTQTCMVPLGNLHGWTRASAWFRSPKCMVPLPALHGWTQKARFWHQKVMLAIHRKSIAQPSRQEVLPPPLKLRRTSRVLILRQVQHPRHPRQVVIRRSAPFAKMATTRAAKITIKFISPPTFPENLQGLSSIQGGLCPAKP